MSTVTTRQLVRGRGLVQVGRRIHETVKSALDLGTFCSNDPVCAQHDPANEHEHRYLHGAACHACLFAPETSCERGNRYLDRAVLSRLITDLDIAFFPQA